MWSRRTQYTTQSLACLIPDHEIYLIVQLVLCVLSDMWLLICFTFIHFLRRGSLIDIICCFTRLHAILSISRSLEEFKMWFLDAKGDVPHCFRGNQNRELAQQWLEKLNIQWEVQRFLQNCHEVRL